MEAAAISIANNALNLVVKTTTTVITNEIGSLLGVQEELFFIKEELDMMQAFLEAASTEKVKGVVVNRWIKQVQELAFDVEDCLQEASVYLMRKSCLPAMCSVKKRDYFARKIQVLKSRIKDVSERNQRYNLINKDNGGLSYDECASPRSIANIETLLVGLDEPKRKLMDLIMKEDGEVISVVGMGGLGKTTLVIEVYGCPELRDKFKFFAWVTILHPFNMEEFIESLEKQIRLVAQEVDNKGKTVEGNRTKPELLHKKPIKEKMEEVTLYLTDKKCLIVLDDLSSMLEWDKMKPMFPTGNGSRIIVTTRYRPMAESISHPSDNVYEIKELSEDHAFVLFCKAVYKTPKYHLVIDDRETKDGLPHESNCNTHEIMEEDSEVHKQCVTINITKDMQTQASLIINNCGRLPLAIVTIGSYLATKPKTSAEWKAMHDHLNSELGNNPDLGVVKTVLTSSYEGMPFHLKPCLLYLSVFHNHKEIRRSRIIRRWMADGYVMESRKKTAAEVGKGYFNDLMGRSLIQPSQTTTTPNGDVSRCNIHDMLYELIHAKAEDENIVSLLEHENHITMTDKVRHLVIVGGPCTKDEVLERVKLSHMRSVSIFGEVGDYLRYPRMKLVRVLDLEGTLGLNNRDLKSVGKLRLLRYLGLRGTKISKLPDSLGKLSELETLDIKKTDVVRLPAGLIKLQKLSYLRAGDSRDGVRVPRGIGALRSLNILGKIDIGPSKSLAKEMQNLTNLSKLAVVGFLKENADELAKVIDRLKHLKSLVLSAANEDGFDEDSMCSGLRCCLDSVSSPPKYLQRLKLCSHLDKLPNWISSLENLEKIHFRHTFLNEINAIGKLPNLKNLYMWDAVSREMEKLCFGDGTFPKLQVMVLVGMNSVKSVSIEETALKRLEQLKIIGCWGITRKGVVSGMEFLVQLKEMEVKLEGTEIDKMFVTNMQEKLNKLPHKPVLRVIKYVLPGSL